MDAELWGSRRVDREVFGSPGPNAPVFFFYAAENTEK
jgi:hypothetical protein